MPEPWYTITDVDRLDSPALVIYPERVKHNINLLKSSIDDVNRLRVHAKTHKSAEAAALLINAGVNKFKCATIAEAEMLGRSGAADVLLAYQPTGPKTDRLIALVRQFPNTSFSCLVDNELSAKSISNSAIEAKITLRVYIDLNVGMNRTGIAPGAEALQLYAACTHMPSLQVLGLHAYDGHIHTEDYQLREQECNEAFSKVEQLRQAIVDSGLTNPIVIAGGSPTFPIHASRPEVECSPGTFIYWDWGYTQQLPEQHYLPAALVITRVVSIPDANKLTLDAGHKSIGSENALHKRIHFLNAPGLKITGHSEEHLMAETRQPHQFAIGDVLYGIPYHVCPTVAFYERAAIVENGKLAGEWKVLARNRKITL